MPRPKYQIWKYYEEVTEGQKPRAKCSYCQRVFAPNPQRMERHLAICSGQVPIDVREEVSRTSNARGPQPGNSAFGVSPSMAFPNSIAGGQSFQSADNSLLESPSLVQPTHFQLSAEEAADSDSEDNLSAPNVPQPQPQPQPQTDSSLRGMSASRNNLTPHIQSAPSSNSGSFFTPRTSMTREIDESLIKALVSEDVPWSFLENPYFQRFCELLCPEYEVPSKTQLASGVVNMMHSSQRNGKRQRGHFS
ncbi:hypothetical protein K493DRAFT_25040 [Basidiobolus meristosporus CBS 931.73]|uniref:BED-type domain-containing protein n=1 Tax=Basidiobolus meristosporus CBS 931.73 TaxID=1314790 RepID=A0A1Y1YBX4_9FUNG|nr:hypothetical protein K493DRAFT_25040 [Basidiobolus meristosporus CBS 931.73]|eukprot:ORX95433.1 hypothetical protein K493DRAFT_25040 [Basidiobolus meristosporus CBS 931.73]